MSNKQGNWMNLKVGDKIKIGKKYAKEHGFNKGEIIQLIEGYFEIYNGLYTETVTSPSIYDEDENEFSSIFHLFGNDLENFLDCEIIN